MTDIEKFTVSENKMVPSLPWEPWPSEFEVQKNDSLALIIDHNMHTIGKIASVGFNTQLLANT